MKDEKNVFKEVWDKEPCNNPLEPAKWTYNIKFVHGVSTRILTCTNSLWRWFIK